MNSLERFCLVALLTEKTMGGLIQMFMASGAQEEKGLLLTYMYLIPLHLPTGKIL